MGAKQNGDAALPALLLAWKIAVIFSPSLDDQHGEFWNG
ncbi:hypothetical protein ACVWXO_004515 [Bradyrhizobium sp. LM2.7]